jgi:hypothetical protein
MYTTVLPRAGVVAGQVGMQGWHKEIGVVSQRPEPSSFDFFDPIGVNPNLANSNRERTTTGHVSAEQRAERMRCE